MKRFSYTLLLIAVMASVAIAGPADDAFKAADQAYKSGDLQQAITQAESGLTVEPDNFKLNKLLGEVYNQTQDYQKSYEHYLAALAKKKKDTGTIYGAGIAAMKLEKYQEALDVFKKGKAGKYNGNFYYGLGIAQTELGAYSEADLNLRKAIDKDETNADFHMALGEENYRNSVFPIAISEFKKAVELNPNFEQTVPDLYYKIAQCCLNMRDVNCAIENYQKLLDLFPQDTTAWLDLARITEASNKPSESSFCYKKYLEINPENGDIWYKNGLVLVKIKNKEEAAESFEKAIANGVNVSESYGQLASLYYDLNEYEKSLTAYTRYEAEFGAPDSVLYWMDKGKVQMKIGVNNRIYFDSAVVSFDQAVALDSTYSNAYEYGGLSLYYKKEYTNAIPYFTKKIELDSAGVNSLRNLAFCYLKTEAYGSAAATLEKALVIKPEDVQMRSMVGKIYTFRKNYPKAISHFEYLFDNENEDFTDSLKCTLYPDLGLAYLSSGRCQKSLSILLKAERCNSRNKSVLMNIASSYQLCNQVNEANSYYKKVLAIDPNDKVAIRGEMETRKQGS